MEEKNEVQRLQEELQALESQLRQQYAHLQQMQQRLQQLDPTYKTVQAPAGRFRNSDSLENFIGLRLIHLVGIVVLVIGLSIGVKYAFDRNLISEITRIGLAYAAGVVLFLLSWRLKKNYGLFSAILFSGAMATVYFTSYAAHVYYGLLPFSVVFGFMVLLTVFTTLQAVWYNRQEIALLGLVGAYGIPFLISRNAERADQLFLYMLIINGGVLYLRYRKNWPLVGRFAQVLTWSLFIGWAATRFQSSQQGMATLFLGAFFVLFAAMVFLRSLKQEVVARELTYFHLVNNIAFFIAALLIFSPSMRVEQMAPVALGCALFAGLQAFGAQRLTVRLAYLAQVHYFLATGLLVLAVAWYFDGLEVTFIWLLLAVALFALGIGLKAKLWRMASLALMALTLLKLLVIDSQRFSAGQKVAAYLTLGLLLLIVSFFYQKFRQKWFEE